MTSTKMEHKKLSIKRVFTKTKAISYTKAIKDLKAMMPNEDVIITNYIGAINKNKKSRKTKKA